MKATNSEIVLNPDGSVYHLHVLDENLADDILLVGDPGRAEMIGGKFSSIRFKAHNREFLTITGTYAGKPVTVISTGIGVDNIDIVVNEIHIAANYDPATGSFTGKRTFNLIRIGTSGALQADVAPGSVVMTECAIGIDNLFSFYSDSRKILDEEKQLAFVKATGWPPELHPPYIVGCSYSLANRLDIADLKGMTITAPGFYAPQGRSAALVPAFPDLNRRMAAFSHHHLRVLNYEMESSAIYALGRTMGHKTLSLCLVVANRERREFLQDYLPAMDALIEKVLESLAKPKIS